MKTGVFWVVDDELLAIPFDKNKYVEGIAKSGETYNHERLWKLVKPKNCNKPYNYYPRGRVTINSRGKVIVYLNPNITDGMLDKLKIAFDIETPILKYDYSVHYKCHLD